MHSLVDGLSRFVMTKIADKGYTEVQANLLTKICQNVDPQYLYKQAAADEGEISPMTEVHNPYKLPLNSELTAFIERSDESASNI